MALDPNEVIDSTESRKPDPNFKGRFIVVTTIVHRDGRVERWQRGEADPPTSGVPLSGYVDAEVRKQFESDRKAEADAAKAAKPDESPKTITAADGSVWQYDPTNADPDVSKRWKMVTPPKGDKADKAPSPVSAPPTQKKIVTLDAQGNKTEIDNPNYEKPKREAPDLNLGAPRPGQKTNLALIQTQFNLLAQQWAADPNVDDAEYNRRIQNYIATYVTPAVQQATAEVNAEADRVRKTQEEAAARANRAEDRQMTTEERLARTGERTAALAQAKFGYDAGQDAVSNAMKLLDYQHNPLFLEQYAAGLNSLARGAGQTRFTADAFRIPLPDTNALAEAGAQRAAALYQQVAGTPFTPRPAGGVMPQPTPQGGPVGALPQPSSAGTMLADPLAAVPFVPPPRDPRLDQQSGGPGSSTYY